MSHISSHRRQQQRIGMRANLRRKMRRMLLEPLETREMMTASDWKIDFGTATSPLANGWTRATENTIYNSTQQFGWKTSAQTLSGDLGASYSDDRRDYVKSANGTFLLDVPRGTYDVTVGILPPVNYFNTALYVEGIPVETVNGTAGQYLEKIYRVNVADEQVDFRLTGTNAFITKLEVHPADSSVSRPLRTIFDPTGINMPYVFDAANYPAVSDFTLRKSGTYLQVVGNSGAVLATQTLSAITGGVEVLGRNNSAENFTLDYDTGGFFNPPVNFQGGNGAGDQVFLKMSQVTTAASVPLIIDTLGSSAVYGPSAANGGTKFVYFGGMESLKVYDGNLLTNAAIGDLYVRGTDADEYLLYYQETGTQIKVNDVPVGGSYYPTNRIISYGRGGNDRMEMNFTLGAGLKAEFRGEIGNDTLTGGLGADLLIGGGGADRLSGGEANDVLWGDDESTATTLAQAAVERATGVVIAGTIAGNDWFDAGGGDDRLFGGGGDDYMMDGLGDDYANGGNGNDTLSSSGGNNLFRGEAGDDGLYGSYGNEIMVGGSGADRIYPRGGRDIAIGGGGADPTLYDDDQDEDIFVFDVSIWDFDNGVGSGLGSNDTALQAILQTWTSNATKAARIATLQAPGPNSLVVGTAIFADCAMDVYIGAPAASNWDLGEAADWRMNDYNDTLTFTDATGCCTGFAPAVDPISNASIPELQAFTYQVSAYDPDTAAGSLVYSLLSGAPSGMSMNSTGLISWTPTEAQGPGSYPVTVQVTDGAHPTTKSFTLTVTEVNQAPVLPSISNKTVEAGSLLTFQVTATDADLPSQSISYSLVGTAPTGATLNSANGTFSWTPTLAQSGSYSVTIRATDSGTPAAYNERTFTITVPYRPIIVPIDDLAIPENELFTLQVQASDVDSPSLTYSFVGTPPSGAMLNSATGAFSWTPSEGQGPGAFPITIQVSDGVHSTTEPFTLTVFEVNQAPVLTVPGPQSIDSGALLSFLVSATDGDLPAHGLTYAIASGGLSGMNLDSSTRSFTWTPTIAQAGVWPVTIRVTDDGNPALYDEETVTITVTPVVVLTEDSRFISEHVWDVIIPQEVSDFEISIRGNVLFDTTATGRMRDTLEFALVDLAGNTLVPTIRDKRDAFFSWSDGREPMSAATAGFSESTMKVTVRPLYSYPGQDARLIARLINNDGDTTSRVGFLPEVGVTPVAPTYGPFPLIPTYFGPDDSVDVALLSDVTESMAPVYRETNYDAVSKSVYAGFTLTNTATFNISGPMVVVVKNISRADVSAINIDGYTAEGFPYYNISRLAFANGQNSPGAAIGGFDLSFHNPSSQPFQYDVRVYGQLNRAPSITSSPPQSVAEGNAYAYDLDAIDPDADQLKYQLLLAPTGMTVNEDTGVVAWSTASVDVGKYVVLARVTDSWGLHADQFFHVTVSAAPNRPPVFRTVPIVDAFVGRAYAYAAAAADPDGDVLTYSKVSGPTELTIGDQTGTVAWMPTAADINTVKSISIKVSDGRGGESSQEFDVYVHPNPLNQPPVIVSQPKLSHLVAGFPAPASGLVSPSSINLDLEPGEVATFPLSIALSPSGNESNLPAGEVNALTVYNLDFNNSENLESVKSQFQSALTSQNSGLVIDAIAVSSKTQNGATPAELQTTTGYFVNNNSTLGLDKYGIVLSTGDAKRYGNYQTPGYQQATFDGVAVSTQSTEHELLSQVSPAGSFFNVTKVDVTFSLLPGYSTVGFDVVFGSDEYPEYINEYVDGFGLFIQRETGLENIAFIGDENLGDLPINIDHPWMRPLETLFPSAAPPAAPLFPSLDGVLFPNTLPGDNTPRPMTTNAVMSFLAELRTGDTSQPLLNQKLTFIIGDANDAKYDSTVYISNLFGARGFPVTLKASEEDVLFATPTEELQGPFHNDVATFQVSVSAGEDGAGSAFNAEFFNADTNELLGSVPITVNSDYRYPVAAVDPDGDILTYHLTGPEGASLDPLTNLIRWNPPAPGNYAFSLEVTDSQGATAVQEFVVTVTDDAGINQAPTLADIANVNAQVGRPIEIRTTASDPDGDKLRYFLTESPTGMSIDSDTGAVTWTPGAGTSDDSFPVTVSVSDRRGGTHDTSFVVHVAAHQISANIAPSIVSSPIRSAAAEEPYIYDVDASDADRDALTYELFAGPEGAAIDPETGCLVWTPRVSDTGIHHLEIHVRDSRGGIGTQGYDLIVVAQNDPPVFTSSPERSAYIGYTWTYQVTADDVNGDVVQYSLGELTDAPSIAISPTGLVEWTPNAAGAVRIHILISDGRGGFGEQEFVLPVVTDSPPPRVTNGPQSAVTLGDTLTYIIETNPEFSSGDVLLSLTAESLAVGFSMAGNVVSWTPDRLGEFRLGVTARDEFGRGTTTTFNIESVAPVQFNGNPPTFTKGPQGPAYESVEWSFELEAEDLDGDNFEFSLDARPAGAVINDENVLRWTPPVGSAGQAFDFVVRVTDEHGSYSTYSFRLPVRTSIATSGPVYIKSFPIFEIALGETYEYQVVAVNPEAGPILYGLEDSPVGMEIDTTGLLTWTPIADGDFEVAVFARNENGEGEMQFYNLRVVAPVEGNEAPYFHSTPPSPAIVGAPYVYLPNVTDPDGDDFTFSLDAATENLGVEINPATGALSWTAATPGVYAFQIIATDRRGGRAAQTFALTAMNPVVPPRIINGPVVPVALGETFQYAVQTDPPFESGAVVLTLSTVSSALGFELDGNVISWEPSETGTFELQLTANNPTFGIASTTTFRIPVVVSRAPMFTTTPTGPAYELAEWSFELEAQDLDGDNVEYSLDAHPTGAVIGGDNILRWTPPVGSAEQAFEFVVRVTDDNDAYSTYSFNLPVRAAVPTSGPVYIRSYPAFEVTLGVTYEYQVLAVHPQSGAIVYGLDESPAEMDIDMNGLLTWTPTAEGDFDVSVFAKNVNGEGQTQSFTLHVVAPATSNQAPYFNSSPSGRAVANVAYFYLPHVIDPDGDDISFTLDEDTENLGADVDPVSGALSWTPTASGSYTLRIIATDEHGAGTVQTFVLNVSASPATSSPPYFISSPLQSITLGNAYQYQLDAVDPDGDPITYSLVLGPTGMSISSDGLLTWQSVAVGVYSVTVAANTTNDAPATQSFSLHVLPPMVANAAPRFTTQPSGPALVGRSYVYAAAAIDPNGDSVEYALSPASVALGVHLADSSSGRITWTPTQAGTFRIRIIATDSRGASRAQDIDLPVLANAAPVFKPVGDQTIGEGDSLLVTLEAYDPEDIVSFSIVNGPTGLVLSQPGGSTFAPWVPAAGTYSVTVRATDSLNAYSETTFQVFVIAEVVESTPPAISSAPRGSIAFGQTLLHQFTLDPDPDGDTAEFELLSGPAGMAVTPSGLLYWIPTADQVAETAYSYSVRVTDSRDESVDATFSILVTRQAQNAAPYFVTAFPTELVANRPLVYTPEAEDPDGDAKLFSLPKKPSGMMIDAHSGLIRWTPALDQVGLHSVSIRVTDALGLYEERSYVVNVRGVNRPPLIDSDAPNTVAVTNELYSFTFRAVDPDGDHVTYSLDPVESLPEMNLDQHGLFTWTPDEEGPVTFKLWARDPSGAGVSVRYTVDVRDGAALNSAPLFDSLPAQFAVSGQAIEPLSVRAIDPEGQPITYSLTTNPSGLNASIIETGLSAGTITWDGDYPANQYVTFIVHASDGETSSKLTIPVWVQQANFPPIAQPVTTTVTVGMPLTLNVHATDVDEDDLLYSIAEEDAALATSLNVTISPLGQLLWNPGAQHVAGSPYEFTINVDDQHGHVVTTTATVTVLADQIDPMVSIVVSDAFVPLGGMVLVTVSAFDNVRIVNRTLAMTVTVEGEPVTTPIALNAGGQAIVTLPQPGVVTFSAAAVDSAGRDATATNVTVTVVNPATDTPEVTLVLPLGNTRVTEAIDVVGSVADEDLVSWTLSARAVAGGVPRILATGAAPVANGILGRIDPTLLRNGLWEIVLSAVDVAGNQSSDGVVVEVEGQLKLGAFTVTFTDVELNVPGLPLSVTRTYSSLDADQKGDFGYGWSVALKQTKLELTFNGDPLEGFTDGTRVVITLPDGEKAGFTFMGTPAFNIPGGTNDYKPRFIPDVGVKSQLLVKDLDLLRGALPGRYLDSSTAAVYDPRNYGATPFTLRLRNGTELLIRADGSLSAVSDSLGNQTVIKPNGLFSYDVDENPTGRDLIFGRDAFGRIVTVTDPAGKQIVYSYNLAGDLTSVKDRAQAVTSFTYRSDRAHFLDKIIDPIGREAARTDYDDDGRIKKITDADLKTIEYEYLPNSRIQKTKDQLGAVTVQEFDSRGNVVRETNPAGNVVKRRYDGQDRLLEEITVIGADDALSGETNDLVAQRTEYFDDANGDREESYDPRGNKTVTYLSKEFAQPDRIVTPTGVTQNSFNAQTGLLQSVRDTNGTTTSFLYDPTGNLKTVKNASNQSLVANTYNKFGEVLTTTAPGAGSEPGRTTYFRYTLNGDRQASWYFEQVSETEWVKIVDETDYDDARRVTGTARKKIPVAGPPATNPEGVETGPAVTLNETSTIYIPTGQVAQSVDTNGLTTEYKYDARGLQVETRTQSPNEAGVLQWLVSETVYDAAGRAIFMTDQHLATTNEAIYGTATEYDAAGRVKKTESRVGMVISIATVGANTHTSSLSNAGTVVTSSSTDYDSAGRVIRTTDNGTKSETFYNRFGEVTETRTQSRDTSSGTPTAVWLVTRTLYDSLGRATFVTDPFVSVNDAHTPDTSPPVHGTLTIYDALGRVTETRRLKDVRVAIDADNGTSIFTGSEGVLLSSTKTFFDSQGRADYTLSATGGRTDYVYDTLGRRIAEIGPTVSIVVGMVEGTPQTQMVRHRAETIYDAKGRVEKQLSNIAVLVNSQGVATGEDRSQIREQRFEYDALGRQTKVTQVGGALQTSVRFEYDAEGRKQFEYDPMNNAKEFVYDEADRLAGVKLPEVHDPEGTVAQPYYQYKYNAQGQQTTLIDAEGRETRWTFDDRGNQISRTLPLGIGVAGADPRSDAGVPGAFTEGFWYDSRGRQIRHVSFEGAVAVNIYDDSPGANGRLVREEFFNDLTTWNNGAGVAAVTVNYKYDAFGRTTEVKRFDAGITKYEIWKTTYDAEGRVTKLEAPNGIVHYEYDNLGRKTKTYTTDALSPSQQVGAEYQYDVLGRLTEVKVSQRTNEVTRYHYDLSGALDLEEQASGVDVDYVYDELGRLDKVAHYNNSGTTQLALYDYSVRDDGKRIREDYVQGFPGNPDTRTGSFQWSYDDVGRLTEEIFDGDGDQDGLDYTARYEFDLVGNRLEKEVWKTADAVDEQIDPGEERTVYAYDLNDRLQTESLDRLTGDDEATTYDWGVNDSATYQTGKTHSVNSVTAQTVAYQYDLDGRLALATTTSYSGGNPDRRERVSYRYDLDGIRFQAKHEVDAEANGSYETTTRTEYLVDPQNHTGYQQVLQERVYDAANQLVQSIDYVIGHDLVSQFKVQYAGTSYFNTLNATFGYDGHGSVRALYDLNNSVIGSGANRQWFLYDAYGNAVGFDPATALTTYLYSGEQWDQRVEIQYLRARFYLPERGHFLSLDAYPGNIESPVTLNKYLYANGDGISFSDPSGNESLNNLMAVQGNIQTTAKSQNAAAFAAGRAAIGRYFNLLGQQTQALAKSIIQSALRNAKIAENQAVSRLYKNTIDFVINHGGKRIFLEVKYRLPLDGSGLTRLANQIRAMSAARNGQPVVWSLLRPSPSQLNAIKQAVGPQMYNKVVFKSGVQELWLFLKAL